MSQKRHASECTVDGNEVTVWNCGCRECHGILASNGDRADCECDICDGPVVVVAATPPAPGFKIPSAGWCPDGERHEYGLDRRERGVDVLKCTCGYEHRSAL